MMRRSLRPALALATISFVLIGTLAACSQGDTGPAAPTLAVDVTGLADGALADIQVTGPNGFSEHVTADATLRDLEPGQYAVDAAGLALDHYDMEPDLATQSLTLAEGETRTAAVGYHGINGALQVWARGSVQPSSFAVVRAEDGTSYGEVDIWSTLDRLPAGRYEVLGSSLPSFRCPAAIVYYEAAPVLVDVENGSVAPVQLTFVQSSEPCN